MTQAKTVGEVDVLLATTVFLLKRKITPYQFSIPRGRGIDTKATQALILQAFQNIDRMPAFYSSGPDVLGISKSEWWQIECKGSGTGKKQTQRNNFDRALASVVSYYEEDTKRLPDKFKNANPFLGLALPATSEYLAELTRRVRMSLRRRLNLWILLYDPEADSIRSISPTDNY